MKLRIVTPFRLAALAGALASAASASVIEWSNPAGGSWYTAANWNPTTVPGTGDVASITLAGTYDIGIGGGSPAGVGTITLSNANVRLLLDNNNDFGIFSNSSLAGRMIINSDQANRDRLYFGASCTIDGPGAIELNASGGDQVLGAQLNVSTGVTGTLGPTLTVRGNGAIGAGGGTILNTGTVGGGTIGGPLIRGNFQQSGAGRIFVDGAGLRASIYDGVVQGGTLQTANGGIIQATLTGGISGITNLGQLNIDNNNDFGIYGSFTDNGDILINSDQANRDRMFFGATCTIGGSGTITLNASGGDQVLGAQLNVNSGLTGTIGPSLTVRGNGAIGAGGGTILNAGTVGGGTIGGPLIRGNFQQSGAGRIFVDGAGLRASIYDGFVQGGTLQTANGGIIQATLTGGISGITNLGQLNIDNNNDFGIYGSFTDNGDILINSDQANRDRMFFGATCTIGGSGTITLNASGGDQVLGAQLNVNSGFTGTFGPSLTVRGNGAIGAGGGTIVNTGTIGGGTIGGPLIRGSFQQSGAGRIFVDGAGLRASIYDGFVQGGTLQTANGGIIQATLTGGISGITNLGQLNIDNNNDFGIYGPFTNNGDIVINSDQANRDRMFFATETSINGTGNIFLNASSGDFLGAQLNTAGSNFGTLAAAQSLRGRGIANGNFNIDGRISPGIPAGAVISGGRTDSLVFNSGSLTLSASSQVDIDLRSASLFDVVSGNSTKALGGTMTVSFVSPYTPAGSTWFDVVTAIGSSVSGRFDALVAPSVPSGPMHLVYFSDRVRLVTCYANCDGSTSAPILNVNDFNCFLNQFAAGDSYANCDGSTIPPVLNINDFNCFLNKFAAGCP